MNATWSSKKLHGIYALLIVGCVATLLASFRLISYAAMVQCGPPPPPQCDPDSGAGFTRGPGGTNNCSPIIIDVSGDGFQLTGVEQGVQFDIAGTGKPVQIAWTAPGSRNAFLVLDRNGDGKITSGRELFGNFSPQPSSPAPNGFWLWLSMTGQRRAAMETELLIAVMRSFQIYDCGSICHTTAYHNQMNFLNWPISACFQSVSITRRVAGQINTEICFDTVRR